MTRDEIVQQALALGPEDRAYVADAIERSLETADVASPELGAAWAAEIERRLTAYDRGELPATEMTAAMQRIRAQLEKHRACG
jgi:putative addiction module component (TIGR02574 family)